MHICKCLFLPLCSAENPSDLKSDLQELLSSGSFQSEFARRFKYRHVLDGFMTSRFYVQPRFGQRTLQYFLKFLHVNYPFLTNFKIHSSLITPNPEREFRSSFDGITAYLRY